MRRRERGRCVNEEHVCVTIDHANILHDVKTLNVGSAEIKIVVDSSFRPVEYIFFSQKA